MFCSPNRQLVRRRFCSDRAQLCLHPLALCYVSMPYLVYKASYWTKRGTFRTYFGYTRTLDLRRWWHEQKPPAWMKPRGGDFDLAVVERGLQTKEVALACEALHAARAIAANPRQARGGP